MGKIKKKTQDNVTAKDKTAVKKPVLKRQELAQKPTYKNLKMGVSLDEQSAPSRGSNIATKQDSLDYASGFKKGLNRKKDPMENTISRMGRWEGQNTPKKYIGGSERTFKTKAKSGKTISKAKNGKSFPDLNKDGKITKADILKGRGVIAKKGATVKKAQMGGFVSNEFAAKSISKPKIKSKPKFIDSPIKTVKSKNINAFQGKKGMLAKSGVSMKKCRYGCK